MTLKQWLALYRQPEYCGINARAHLKAIARGHGNPARIHLTISINALDSACRRLIGALARRTPG